MFRPMLRRYWLRLVRPTVLVLLSVDDAGRDLAACLRIFARAEPRNIPGSQERAGMLRLMNEGLADPLRDPLTCLLRGDDVQPIPRVDRGNVQDQRRERGLVVVLGGFIEHFVGHRVGSVGEACP